jgi:hypothetical protein
MTVGPNKSFRNTGKQVYFPTKLFRFIIIIGSEKVASGKPSLGCGVAAQLKR